MGDYEKFTFILCLAVFLMLTFFVVFVLAYIYKLTSLGIQYGVEDEAIINEQKKYTSTKEDKNHSFGHGIGLFFSSILLIAITSLFVFSLFVKFSPESLPSNFSQVHVVESNSMSKKREENRYLFENNLDDQFQIFDLIVTHELPLENDLQLYDIVVYEIEGILVVHRIIDIEEPNEQHPDCRHFTLKGDANENIDRRPVLYSQMRSIYRGERVQYIGSFVLFLQSPAGFICIVLIAATCVAIPIMERSLDDERGVRFRGHLLPKRRRY